MSSQEDVTEKGGTMRLGAYPCKLAADTLAREAYGEELVYERHRHRFEFNNAFRDQLEDAGLVISGLSPDERLVEMVELPRDVHPWFVATQLTPSLRAAPPILSRYSESSCVPRLASMRRRSPTGDAHESCDGLRLRRTGNISEKLLRRSLWRRGSFLITLQSSGAWRVTRLPPIAET